MFLRSEANAPGEGAAVPLEVMWRLTIPWYSDRLDPGFRRREVGEYQSMLSDAGLTGPFWSLT